MTSISRCERPVRYSERQMTRLRWEIVTSVSGDDTEFRLYRNGQHAGSVRLIQPEIVPGLVWVHRSNVQGVATTLPRALQRLWALERTWPEEPAP